MSSFTGPSSSVHVFSLPLEVVEQVLVACSSFGSPESIASFSQSCRLYYDLVYGSTDSHLWREVFLATFEDPRPKNNLLNQPMVSDTETVTFDWKNEFQRRIRARKMFQSSTMDTRALASNFGALSSIATSSPPPIPGISVADDHDSTNVSWMERVFADGFPPALLRRLTLSKINASDAKLFATLPIAEQIIMRPDWERSAAGQAFYKLFFLSGFRGGSSNSDDEIRFEERYNLRSSSARMKEIEQSKMSEGNQRALARTVARHRVYHLPYLSHDRCWGPFMRANSPPPPIDEDGDSSITPTDAPQENGKGKGKGKERAVEEAEDVENSPSKGPRRGSTKKVAAKDTDEDLSSAQDDSDSEAVQVDMSFIRAILTNFYSGLPHHNHDTGSDEEEEDPDFVIEVGHSHHHHRHHRHHHQHEGEEHNGELEELGEDYQEEDTMSDVESISFYTDDGSEPSLDLFSPASGPLPVYPPYPHLLFPDYAFLSAARLVVTENLWEKYENGSTTDAPMWPWFTTASAFEATREILLRMGIPLSPKPNNLDSATVREGEDGPDGSSSGSEQTSGDRGRGWESLRMGSAPGFWECRGTREGWTGVKDEEERERSEMPTPWKKDESVEFVDGWDWAGAEGRWMRAVCWMDYRDLLFHNLQASYPLAARYHQEIQETCRVFPMTLKVVGFSRVQPPNTLPSPPPSSSASSSSPSSSSSKGQGKGKGKAKRKEKEKAKECTASGSYDPLVYALPVIHVEGEFRGSDVDETVTRRARGTVRMIGDRAIRWNLISSEVSSPDRDEWVMEGVQVGGIGSAMGVVGMWTGAGHERGDPIGPSWAWKME
ncbi:hypothetical protein GYMLUDRAFT_47798 [Collybiopsis luxurians FD-317 M1]|uniref:F-box domain-containing protein n=1 Tax=Collybiopsis luxurians FD-317 M1 TaxID=944289 RepID=A0A0D0CKG9_9AGAR|nr:hypothetical protein GYMLUDRAFT_47798 [Collybiopsis luxurians FD-317 M1]